MISGADTAWVLISTALVILMTPALGLFYGGLVKTKNALNTLLHSLFLLGAISLQWALIGYSLAFGPDHGGLIGGPDWFGLRGVGGEPNTTYAATIPHSTFMMFQMAFAIITPALISGAFAERKKFSAFVLFSLLWATFVYDPVAHWVWGSGGWLHNLGALDFAGGTVVHITSGVSALVCAHVIGPRTPAPYRADTVQDALASLANGEGPHNAVITLVGAALLWFGWFGFNAGSALGANALASQAFVTTHLAASGGAVAWVISHYVRTKKVSVLGIGLGGVAGLVCITPAAGFVSPLAAILMGVLAGLVCSVAVEKAKLLVDDSLDVFGVHGVGGILGAVLTGLLATDVGGFRQVGIQVLAVATVAAYSAAMTWGILKLVGLVVNLRVTPSVEESGLDEAQHGETAYRL